MFNPTLLVVLTAVVTLTALVSLWCELRDRFALGMLATVLVAGVLATYGHKTLAVIIYFAGPAIFAAGAVASERLEREARSRRRIPQPQPHH